MRSTFACLPWECQIKVVPNQISRPRCERSNRMPRSWLYRATCRIRRWQHTPCRATRPPHSHVPRIIAPAKPPLPITSPPPYACIFVDVSSLCGCMTQFVQSPVPLLLPPTGIPRLAAPSAFSAPEAAGAADNYRDRQRAFLAPCYRQTPWLLMPPSSRARLLLLEIRRHAARTPFYGASGTPMT